ncbi:MAG: hypothetical protein KAJ51_16155, partial [Thermoplasmata archaeon]|nr:hypothetical protein [Thermoplasmata archaeon]
MISLILIPLNLYFWDIPEKDYSGILIDNEFEDWSSIQLNSDIYSDQEDNINVNLINYQVLKDDHHYSFYLEVYGTILNGVEKSVDGQGVTGLDTIHIFLDTDLNSETGYQTKNLGADLLVEIKGHDEIKFSSVLKRFDNDRNRYDWNGWVYEKSNILVGNKNKRLETQIPVEFIRNSNPGILVLFHIQDSQGHEDFSDKIIGADCGLLRIDQESIGEDILNLNSNDNSISRIKLEHEGNDVFLNSLTMNRTGTATDADTGDVSLYLKGKEVAVGEFSEGQVTFNLAEPILVKSSEPTSLEVKIDITSDAVKSHVLGVRLDANEDISIDSDLPIITDSNLELKYIEEVPDGIIIDGAFEDWSEVSINIDSDDVQISDHNVDLKDYQITQSLEYLSF